MHLSQGTLARAFLFVSRDPELRSHVLHRYAKSSGAAFRHLGELITRVLIAASFAIGYVAAQEPASEFENARDGVQYVGTEQCIDCHRDYYQSYLQTTHSAATRLTDPAQEADSAVFEQALTGIRYEVLRRDGKLIHREVLRDVDGETLAVTEKPIRYTVGSGAHGKSYLYESGSFLGQSPITWFDETKSWGMSPGFDRPFHKSFHRTVGTDCVFCHVGSIDREKQNPYKFEILETTIGCERCHGPGELHVARYRDDPDATGVDRTIVNPTKLSRELGEAICQQCHLQGIGKADVSGKDSWDYRPGLALTDFRVDYQLGLGGQRMRIVGHVEQLHASECYQQNETLTCVTCHDPHNPVPTESRIDFHRQVCLNCHADETCGKPLAERERLADNSCYQCHMPKAPTNVTHAAFHHHRIGIHEQSESEESPTGALLPVIDVSRLTKREQDRCAALAKIALMDDRPLALDYEALGMQATETLIRLKQTGPVDARTDSELARLAFAQDQRQIARDLAGQALNKEVLPTMARIEATRVLAQIAFQSGDAEKAVELYRLLANYHRDARDMFFLGLCENNAKNVSAAIAALERSIEIDPTQVGPHSALRAIYTARGETAKAKAHAEAQERLTALREKWAEQAQAE